MSNNTGGPAFPHHIEHPNGHWPGVTHAGMTLRDYFAAKAMQAMLCDSRYMGVVGVNNYQHRISEYAYALADAMLKAREASK